MEAQTLTGLVFDKPYRNYNVGDFAGFSGEIAPELCAAGVAHMPTSAEKKARDASIKAKVPRGPELLVAVKITGSVPRYNRGDIAGFPEAKARQLVEVLGVAIYTEEARQAPVRSRAEIVAARLEGAKDEKKGRRPKAKKSPVDREASVPVAK